MSPRVKLLSDLAQFLTDRERMELAHLLLGDDITEKDPGYDEAWAAEIKRRIEEFDRGEVKSIPWSVVRETLFAKHTSHTDSE
ncbi:MAG: addiction module protein [Planctomycetaceae bacterium]|nr:addiction module protein [Planctomycetaceae bacterium]